MDNSIQFAGVALFGCGDIGNNRRAINGVLPSLYGIGHYLDRGIGRILGEREPSGLDVI